MSKLLRNAVLALAATAFLPLSAASAKEVGKVGVDWLGNDILIEAIADPQVKGVTCHVAYFDRGLIDRLQKGNWFEDPSNSSIACRQTGPIEIGDIDLDEGGEEIFKSSRSLIWKKLVVKRIYDRENNTLIYLSAFTPGAGRLGEDGDLDRAALRPGRTACGEISFTPETKTASRLGWPSSLSVRGRLAAEGVHHLLDDTARR